VSLPERLAVKQFGGNALSAELLPPAAQNYLADGADDMSDVQTNAWTRNDLSALLPGQIGGIVVDPNGAIVPGANVTVNTQSGSNVNTTSDSEGRWIIAGIAPGPVQVRISRPGFKDTIHELNYDASRPLSLGTTLEVGQISEVVTITASRESERQSRQIQETALKNEKVQANVGSMPSQNVFNLTKRVAGILPVRFEVPRSGRSYRFVRPLVLDEETRLTFQYKWK
jgi:hypothetical protein